MPARPAYPIGAQFVAPTLFGLSNGPKCGRLFDGPEAQDNARTCSAKQPVEIMSKKKTCRDIRAQ
jgi:hypothetical protein